MARMPRVRAVISQNPTAVEQNFEKAEDIEATEQRTALVDSTHNSKASLHIGAQREVDGSEKEKTHADKKSTGLKSLFRVLVRYSTGADYMLQICGFIAACAAGSTLPLMTIVFGSSVNKFNAFGAGDLSSSALYHEVARLGLWFLYLFLARFFLIYIHTICFGFTATRATKALRHDFLKSLLRQDIAYLDTCSPGTIASTVSNNADVVENTLSEKVGGFVFVLSMIVSAFVVALTRQWKLTLVTGTSLPAIVAGFGLTFALGMINHSCLTRYLLTNLRCKD